MEYTKIQDKCRGSLVGGGIVGCVASDAGYNGSGKILACSSTSSIRFDLEL